MSAHRPATAKYIALACLWLWPCNVLVAQIPAEKVDVEAMVDSLASPNPQPTIEDDGFNRPATPQGFSSEKSQNVFESWKELVECEEPNVLVTLVGHLEDNRYSATIQDGGAWTNFTVGHVCLRILTSKIEFYLIDLPRDGDSRGTIPSYCMQHMLASDPSDEEANRLAQTEWIEQHVQSDIFTTQCEAIEWMILEEQKNKNITHEMRERSVDYLLKEQKKMKKSGKAVVARWKAPNDRL